MRLIGRFDEERLFAPHEARAVLGADCLPLPVGEEVDDDARGAGQEDGGGERIAEMDRVIDQIERRRGVDARNPDEAAPADHKASPVVHDVERAEIAGFPKEKFTDVNELKGNRNDHCVA